jgi:hypothetical protein
VKGDGFSFTAPAGWTIEHQRNSLAATSGSVLRLEVLSFTLEKPYRTALFAAAARELDSVAGRVATQLKGKVASSTTVHVAGRKARSYRIEYGPGKVEEIAFVLKGRSEYELLCRRPASSSDTSCADLFASFALG